jgi:hypothetical protein
MVRIRLQLPRESIELPVTPAYRINLPDPHSYCPESGPIYPALKYYEFGCPILSAFFAERVGNHNTI